jgi:DNA polymerase V
MFGLVDCNNFYASCQRVFEPHLRDKPVVILSNNDGCVIARSNEAKALGIKMGSPAFECEELFRKNQVHIYSSNFALYGDMSSRVMNTLAMFTPLMEIYSIDEAFLKFEGFDFYNLKEYGEKIQKVVTKGTGIPISVGIAPTKTLAKVANKIAKKYPIQTRSSYVIDTEQKRIKALKWTDVGDIWGIGARYALKLRNIGVNNAYQFSQLSDDWVKKELSIVGLRIKHELMGNSMLDLEKIQHKKAIATTRSFEKIYTKYEDLSERVSAFTAYSSEKLRKQNSHSNLVMVFIRTNYFRKDQPQYSRSIVIKTDYATSSYIELNRCAQIGLKKIYKPGYHYKKAGVILMGISPDSSTQLSLFESPNPKHRILMRAMDQLNQSIGSTKVMFAGQSLDRKWKMKQEKLSPYFTTKIKDIIKIKLRE